MNLYIDSDFFSVGKCREDACIYLTREIVS